MSLFRVVGIHPDSDSEWFEGPVYEKYEDAVRYAMSLPDDEICSYLIVRKKSIGWQECFQNYTSQDVLDGERTFKDPW